MESIANIGHIVNKVEERLARHGACDVARLLDACMLRRAGLPNKQILRELSNELQLYLVV